MTNAPAGSKQRAAGDDAVRAYDLPDVLHTYTAAAVVVEHTAREVAALSSKRSTEIVNVAGSFKWKSLDAFQDANINI